MNLWEYCGKHVKITVDEGQSFTGRADLYTSALDNPNGVETLSIWQDDSKDTLIEFEIHEIAYIEILSDNPVVIAEAI